MTIDEYNRFCRALTSTTHVVQWGGAHVWKVGGKVFGIARQDEDDGALHVTFKCSAMSYDMLKEMPGCRPAPYLASRGMKWIQRISNEELSDAGLNDYLRASYILVVNGLTRRTREELALADTSSSVKANSIAASMRPISKAATRTKAAPAKPKARKGAKS